MAQRRRLGVPGPCLRADVGVRQAQHVNEPQVSDATDLARDIAQAAPARRPGFRSGYGAHWSDARQREPGSARERRASLSHRRRLVAFPHADDHRHLPLQRALIRDDLAGDDIHIERHRLIAGCAHFDELVPRRPIARVRRRSADQETAGRWRHAGDRVRSPRQSRHSGGLGGGRHHSVHGQPRFLARAGEWRNADRVGRVRQGNHLRIASLPARWSPLSRCRQKPRHDEGRNVRVNT